MIDYQKNAKTKKTVKNYCRQMIVKRYLAAKQGSDRNILPFREDIFLYVGYYHISI